MFSKKAEIIGKIIAEFVAEMIRDNLKEELFLIEELFLVEECITQKGINTRLILKFHHQLITLTVENK